LLRLGVFIPALGEAADSVRRLGMGFEDGTWINARETKSGSLKTRHHSIDGVGKTSSHIMGIRHLKKCSDRRDGIREILEK
jgi:hypothetical protein